MHALALESLRIHREHWDDLERRSATRFGARAAVRLHVALDDAEAANLLARQELYAAAPGFSARWLEPDDLRRLEPRICEEARGGLLTEGNAHVDPAPYTRAVAEAATSLGARIVTADAVGLRHDGGAVESVLTTGGEQPCDRLLIAPGVWAQKPSEWLGLEIPVAPLKGELLLVDCDGPQPQADISWRDVGVYAAGGTRLVLGGVEDEAGYDEAPTRSAADRILAGVRGLLPGIGELQVLEQRAGLRPMTPDGFPIVGLVPGWENVCVAAGSGRKGMLYGAGLGQAAAELLLDGQTALPIQQCAPDREVLV
jgi:glycine oxidase